MFWVLSLIIISLMCYWRRATKLWADSIIPIGTPINGFYSRILTSDDSEWRQINL